MAGCGVVMAGSEDNSWRPRVLDGRRRRHDL